MTAIKGKKLVKGPSKGEILQENSELRENLKHLQMGFTRSTQLSLQTQQNLQQLNMTLIREVDSLHELLQYNAKPANSTAETGDIILIDFIGQLKNEDGSLGKTFEGGKAKNFPLKLGSGRFIEGFEKQLIGIKRGELKQIEISFPENYNIAPALAGKPAIFHVHAKQLLVNSIKNDPILEIENKLKENEAKELTENKSAPELTK